MKMAAFAECFGINVELNGDGGLFGAVSAHLLASIPNTTYFEMTRNGPETARVFGITNVPAVENGELGPTRALFSASWSTLASPIALRN